MARSGVTVAAEVGEGRRKGGKCEMAGVLPWEGSCPCSGRSLRFAFGVLRFPLGPLGTLVYPLEEVPRDAIER